MLTSGTLVVVISGIHKNQLFSAAHLPLQNKETVLRKINNGHIVQHVSTAKVNDQLFTIVNEISFIVPHLFSAECTIGMVRGLSPLEHYGTMALWHYGTMALWNYGTMELWQ